MNIGLSKIAEKLGLVPVEGDDVTAYERADQRDHIAEQARIAGIAGRNKQKFFERPTGYGRAVRRQRNRDTDSARKKTRRATFRNNRQAEDFYETAGQLGRIYFELIPARPEVRARVLKRVDGQAARLAKQEEISFDDALSRIEQSMLANVQEADRRVLARQMGAVQG